ncbi:hypothetical protein [Moheibacter sediminis]|uniref:Uncharacterized protein n=1 Tax=Moheibacter sediminis TaxID=1434700 RepID=A0A1W1Z6A1_9FLAO|nr:hypothetical protein [Moheibacter sediminis]SMC43935.1 hypothetical protein SAMN06296427_102234 [Moheibacter sediminis]
MSKHFFEPFAGLICQANENWKDYPFDKFPDEYFKNQIEVENYFGEAIHDRVSELSSKFPEKEIAFVYIDCYGGRCTSEGYVIKNKEKILEQESHHSGHQIILKQIYPDYNSWFFYPFTRTYFSDKGGITGDLINITFPAVWMMVSQEFGNDNDYTLQAAEHEMFLDCPNKFNLYFMKISDSWIKIMGSIVFDDKEVFEKVKYIIEDLFLGMEYNIQIDNFENGDSIVLSTIDDTKNKAIKSISYRTTAFNTQSFNLSDTDSGKANSTVYPENNKKGFWSKLFGK